MIPDRTTITTTFVLGLLIGLGGVVQAQHVYKSVDAEGRVTYSATPPSERGTERVEELDLEPGPTPEEQQAAHQRMRGNAAASQTVQDQREAERAKRSAAVSAAQQELIRARADLEQAKIPGDSDWQHLAKGGRVLSANYFARLTAAEDRVAKAEEALQAAREGR
jgi:hypothetical protein